MSIKSISEDEIKIDHSIKTAVIYTVDEIGTYLVEVRHLNDQYFISNKNFPVSFSNLSEALKAARHEGIAQAFLALSKTSEEVGLDRASIDPKIRSHQYQYDYLKLEI